MDDERSNFIVSATLAAIKANYVKGPVSPDRVFEALRALAISTAYVLAGGDFDSVVTDFFTNTFAEECKKIMRERSHDQVVH
jgi:hypothetical protein